MHDNLEKEKETSRKPSWFPIILVALAGVLIICGALQCMCRKSNKAGDRMLCATNLAGLGRAMREYCDEFQQYPSPGNWCDLLMEYARLREQVFKCPANKEARCSFAMNPGARPSGPSDMVVLFETRGGWNQYGGAELLTLENHAAKRGHVLFNNGHIEFVKADRIGDLRWKVEEEGNGGIGKDKNEQ